VGLLGGSGAGKTTLLRLIAGLTRRTSGEIVIGGQSGGQSNGQPRVGMVFQNLALWPHLTALEHLSCVLFRHPARSRRARAEALLAEMRLPVAVWNHRPAELSGGESQRLALARALAIEPEILLLDEPLAHLDPPLRAGMLEFLRDCVVARRTTCILVTHSWDEAAAICERIAVLDRGRLAQEGTPAELYWRPSNDVVARWSGLCIELPQVWLQQGKLSAARAASQLGVLPADGEKLVLRPQQLVETASTEHNRWTVVEQRPRSGGWWTTVARDGDKLSLFTDGPRAAGAAIGVELRPPADCQAPTGSAIVADAGQKGC
jgi:ABC-type sulfate/molybdate transport systems ATPase subunit